MPANSVELTSLNITDSHETCHNGFDYSSCEKTFKSDANISSEDKETKGEDTLTDFQGFMLLIPSYIGVGFLGLPYIVKILGLWGGSTGLFFYGMLNEVASLILVECTKRLSERTGERFSDMGRVAEISMKMGPPCLQPHAGKLRFFIDFSIFMTYALVMPDLISLMNLFGKDILRQYVDINDNVSIVAISVLLLPIYLTRRMKLLSFVATAGNIVLVGLFVISFQYICQDLPDVRTRPAIKLIDYITITSYTNDVMFSCCGIAMILPVRDKMKTKKNFDGWNGVLGLVLVIVTCFHAFCGFYGYLKFGEMTKVNYLLNLPGDKWLYKSLKILSFLTLYSIHGITVFVVVKIIWTPLKGKFSREIVQNYGENVCRVVLLVLSLEIIWTPLKGKFSREIVQNYGEYVCRGVLLVLSCIFTILVPEFELLMSLTGCIGVLFTTLAVPYIVALLTMYGDLEPSNLVEKVKRKLTFTFCVLALGFGIYSTIAGIGVAVYMILFHIVL